MAQIFSPAQIAAVQQAIQDAEKGKAICAKGAACGFDTSGHHATLHAVQQQLQQVLRQFTTQGVSES
jgi:hypothetical protein